MNYRIDALLGDMVLCLLLIAPVRVGEGVVYETTFSKSLKQKYETKNTTLLFVSFSLSLSSVCVSAGLSLSVGAGVVSVGLVGERSVGIDWLSELVVKIWSLES